jgi:transposase InsO family protein
VAFDLLELDGRDLRAGPHGSGAIDRGSPMARAAGGVASHGIRDKPIAPGSLWQNGIAERLFGSIRRECVDPIIALGEEHLR